ncbi:unnamed protein product [Urochloa humidicola]
MCFRRFLYLVADDCIERTYSLRRIDMSRFFRPLWEGAPTPLDSSGGAGATDPSALEDAGRLPEPTISFSTPRVEGSRSALIDFLLFKNKGRDDESLQVVTMDHTGRALLCDPSLQPECCRLPMVRPKLAPFSLTVGSSLYVMDAFPKPPNGSEYHSFEVLSCSHRNSDIYKEWYWHTLQPPPFVHGPRDPSHYIESYAVVAGTNILMSNMAKHTYCFDTAKSKWRKVGDWPMPFSLLAEYVPKYKLWFGLSSMGDGHSFLAANLMPPSDLEEMSPPVVHGSWREYVQPPPEWSLVRSQVVHLGCSKFCIIRFFEVGQLNVCSDTGKTFKVEEELQVVLTGVEVVSCDQELWVFKHKSERYKLNFENDYWVL